MAFSECKVLKNAKLSCLITCVSEGMFCGCEALEQCPNLNTSVFPDTIAFIEEPVVTYTCLKPGEISINIGISNIPDVAFYDREDIVSAMIPDGVTVVGLRSFDKLTVVE